jgi:hypothetical protein
MSVAPGPLHAHNPNSAEATMYRRRGGGPWREVEDGLPSGRGTRAWVIAADPANAATFYGAPHGGELYRSTDAGATWRRLDVAWPGGKPPKDVNGLAVGPG